MHIRKERAFTDKETAFLARFPLLTFEKANGHKQYGSVEKKTLAAARAVKAVNPNAKILYYRNVMVHYDGYAFVPKCGRLSRYWKTSRYHHVEMSTAGSIARVEYE